MGVGSIALTLLALAYASAEQSHQLPTTMPTGPACPMLSRELLQAKAKNNFVILTVVDKLVMQRFGRSFVQNIMSANISYWFISALDPWTSLTLGAMGPEVRAHCFNAPRDRLKYKGEGACRIPSDPGFCLPTLGPLAPRKRLDVMLRTAIDLILN